MLKGINVSEEIEKLFSKGVRFQNVGYMIVRLDKNGSSIELKSQGKPGYEFKEVADQLPENECRIVFMDFNFDLSNKRKISKTIMVQWVPQGAPIQEKFKYSSSKSEVLKIFKGVQYEFHCDCQSDFSFEDFKNNISKKIAQ